jgi:hypothetical protein
MTKFVISSGTMITATPVRVLVVFSLDVTQGSGIHPRIVMLASCPRCKFGPSWHTWPFSGA